MLSRQLKSSVRALQTPDWPNFICVRAAIQRLFFIIGRDLSVRANLFQLTPATLFGSLRVRTRNQRPTVRIGSGFLCNLLDANMAKLEAWERDTHVHGKVGQCKNCSTLGSPAARTMSSRVIRRTRESRK